MPRLHVSQFINNGGSSFVDMDGVRYISLDYTLFISGGEDEADVSKKNYGNVHALYPIRHKVCGWLKESLEEAQRKVHDLLLYCSCDILILLLGFVT